MSESLTAPPQGIPKLVHAGPRIDSLDLLRGIAILGIFLMNTWTMSLPQDTYTNPATYNPTWIPGHAWPLYDSSGHLVDYEGGMRPLEGLNHWVYVGIHLLADMKFITTFSMLFGAGIVLQAERSRKKGNNPWLTHYIRMSILLIFGLIHTFGFWYGDILTDYALCGLILAPVRLLPAWILGLTGILMVAVPTATMIAKYEHRHQVALAKPDQDEQTLNNGWYYPLHKLDELYTGLEKRAWSVFREHEQAKGIDTNDAYPPTNDFPIGDSSDENNRELATYRGSWWDQVVGHRFWCSVTDHTAGFLDWTFWRCGGCFLIGMALQKRRFFHGAWPLGAYATFASFAIPIGWIISYLGVMFNDHTGWSEDWNSLFSLYMLGDQFNYWGSLLCSFGYMAVGVLLAAQAARPGSILNKCLIPIRSIGRMALTCYLAETLIGTSYYYNTAWFSIGKFSWGGQFGHTTRAGNLPLVFGTWMFLLIFAPLWLTYFRQGPFEWLWHSIAYWDWKNPRKEAAGPDASLSPDVEGVAGAKATA
jgi:uncharacterized protein